MSRAIVSPPPHQPVAFNRHFADGSRDLFFCPIDVVGCNALSLILANRLKRGEYRSITLRLANGQTVHVRPLVTPPSG